MILLLIVLFIIKYLILLFNLYSFITFKTIIIWFLSKWKPLNYWIVIRIWKTHIISININNGLIYLHFDDNYTY